MSIPLIDLNEDLKKLKDEGYNVSVLDGNLVVKGIPYVNKEKRILFGTLYCPLTISGEKTGIPQDHTVRFMGEHPCDQFGKEDNSFVNSASIHPLNAEITGSYYFSSKPESGNYPDFYTKMSKYIELLSSPAKSIDPGISAQYNHEEIYEETSVFKYFDTYTARAELTGLSEKLKNQKIAIVGLGGTGSFLLDFISKTPVQKISLFDGDEILNHNAFRMPGAMSITELKERPSKVTFFKEKYEHMRSGIEEFNLYLDESNVDLLDDHDFVFLALDKAKAKKSIIDHLVKVGIPFIDLGMGITLAANNSLRGTLRKTLVTPDNSSYLSRIAMEEAADEDVYAQNIQISELNALNAIQGIITWKKLSGFYSTEAVFSNSTFIVDEEEISNEA